MKMAASWHLAPSLAQLRSELNRKWPDRSKASDGSIGNAEHSARASDHNPNARRSVNAIDVTNDGIDLDTFIAALVRDGRVNYVISRGKIRRRKTGFVPEKYTGINGHFFHVHVSILQTVNAEQDTSPWGLATPGLPTTGDRPTSTTPTTPTAPTGGLTVSEATAILNALTSKTTGLPYLSAQIKAVGQSLHDKTKALGEQSRAIAEGAFGRTAINARNADTAAIVQKVVTAALGQVPGVDMAKVAATVKEATTQALAERDAVDADAVMARIVEKLEA